MSGQGRFGGYEGFKQWSNQKAVVQKWQLNMFPINYLGPPYNKTKINFLRRLFALLGIQRKQVTRPLKCLIILFVLFYLGFSKRFDVEFRREIYGFIIGFLKPYA